MDKEQYDRQKINEFLLLVSNEDEVITSTGASVVNISGTLYNVDGSTPDPKRVPGYKDKSWKDLLIAKGIPSGSPCYITNAVPAGTSHPEFSVGGHMTPSSDGNVSVGGSCYLMPECQWHNNKARDGIAFYHSETAMLQLTGYMQGELGATFQIRLPCSEAFGLLYNLEGDWQHQNFATKADAEYFLAQLNGGQQVEHHLFERHIQLQGQNQRLTLVKV